MAVATFLQCRNSATNTLLASIARPQEKQLLNSLGISPAGGEQKTTSFVGDVGLFCANWGLSLSIETAVFVRTAIKKLINKTMRNKTQKKLIEVGKIKRLEKENKELKEKEKESFNQIQLLSDIRIDDRKELANKKREISRQTTIASKLKDKIKKQKEQLTKCLKTNKDKSDRTDQLFKENTSLKGQRDSFKQLVVILKGLNTANSSIQRATEKKHTEIIRNLKETRQRKKRAYKKEIKKYKLTIAVIKGTIGLAIAAQVVTIVTLLINR